MKFASRVLKIVIVLVLLAGALSTNPARAAGICYVNDDASGTNNGTDWSNAYTNLQSAIADPCTEIWVAAGTYRPDASNRTISFTLEIGTAIYGGFAGTETMISERDPETNVTILSGDLNGDDSGFTNNGENSYHVVYANTVDNTAILDGFTISGGNANGISTDSQGGGIYSSNSDAALANLIFRNNAGGYGGGMHAGAFTGSTLTNVTFKDNASSTAGGGLYMTVATVSLSGVTFINNTSYAGGGMFIANQLPTLTNVTFSSNTADLGGGLYVYNTAPTLTNVTFSGNSATIAAGGLYVDNTSVPILANVIIANSSNGDCVVNSGSIDGTSSNNLIEDTAANACGLTDGVNGDIIGTDPGLGTLADNGGTTLTFLPGTGSAAIDAGTNTGCTATDQRGTARPQNSTCDIGAVERDLTAPTVNTFSATSPSTSLAIPIPAFTASDAVGVTGYKITETATPPSAGAAGWTSLPPTSYTVNADGSYTLYAWAKDQDGNVSALFTSASVDADATAPTITFFTVPSPVISLSIPVTFLASDNIGVTGYMITESATPPPAGDSGWSGAPLSYYTVGTDGTYTLYPWAKDAAGNVSSLFGSPPTVSVDTTAPSVTSFTAPSSATSFSIPITAFSASDNMAVTAYRITESSTPPSGMGAGWSPSTPTSYTVSSSGSYTLYPWVKDSAGNVSAVYGSPASVSVCLSPATVSNTNDSGAGSLRQALADACSGATINFDAGLADGTIRLASPLTLSKNVTIDGSSVSSITISGDSDANTVGDVRVFGVDPGITVTLNSLTIMQGYANEAGAIFNEGNLTITHSTLSYNTSLGYSGAISSNTGSLTITNSTFFMNTALGNNQGAGAILSNGDLTITGSTFANNTASVGDSGGGAIYNTDPDTVIANSTFSGNSAGKGGAIYTTNSMSITNSTFSNNSANNAGGLYIDGGTTNLENTIIANSTGGDCTNTTIGLGTNINNLIEDNSCYPHLSGDPKLGTLASNGGPTETIALLANSPAIDAGDDPTCFASPINSLDQRGTSRPNGGHCDIGAYELVDTTAPTVTAFTATSPINNLTIPITSFTASDNAVLTGYKITETSTPPLAGAAGWTSSAPTSYTVASADSYTLYPWAKDAAGNVSAVYGTPVSVTVDLTAPTVSSITRASTNPSSANSLQFTVTFSEAVIGTSASDFSLTTTGVTGTAISSVSNSGMTRTVNVSTGSGNGTIRLNVPATATITDLAGNSLSGLPFTSSQTYTIDKTKTLTLTSLAAQDGWVLESSENSNVGFTLNSNATTFNLGDDATKKQYRGILSFNTAIIPDIAIITSATLKVKKSAVVGGGNPVSIFQGFFADVKKGFFNTASTLQTADFQATASKTVGPTSPTPSANVYTINLIDAKTFINKLTSNDGITQIRLRFKLDDNGNIIANYLSLFSGNATNTADRPQLVITYYVP